MQAACCWNSLSRLSRFTTCTVCLLDDGEGFPEPIAPSRYVSLSPAARDGAVGSVAPAVSVPVAAVIAASAVVLWPCDNMRRSRHDFLVTTRAAVDLSGLSGADIADGEIHVLPASRARLGSSGLEGGTKRWQRAVATLSTATAAALALSIAAALVISAWHG